MVVVSGDYGVEVGPVCYILGIEVKLSSLLEVVSSNLPITSLAFYNLDLRAAAGGGGMVGQMGVTSRSL